MTRRGEVRSGQSYTAVLSNANSPTNDVVIAEQSLAILLDWASITPMHLSYARAAQESAIVGWPEDSFLSAPGEPFGFPVDTLLERFNEDRLDVPIAGGMTSGVQTPGASID